MNSSIAEGQNGVFLLRLLGKLPLDENGFLKICQSPEGRKLIDLAATINENKIFKSPSIDELDETEPLIRR